MRNLRTTAFLLLGLGLVTFFSTSCEKDEEVNEKPVITDLKVGHEDGSSDPFNLGGVICLEFNVEMENDDKLKSYHVEIHDEPASGLVADEYKIIDEEFDISGLRNTHIHDHIEIDVEANTGNYHFHLTVTSENGFTSSEEAHLVVIDNPNAPAVSNFSVANKNGGTTYAVGDIIVVSFDAEAKNGATLDNYALEIHDEPDSGLLEDETNLVEEENFTANFQGLTTANVSQEVEITAGGKIPGHWHIHLHVSDNADNVTAKVDEINID